MDFLDLDGYSVFLQYGKDLEEHFKIRNVVLTLLFERKLKSCLSDHLNNETSHIVCKIV